MTDATNKTDDKVMIRITNLKKSFKDLEVLKGINIDVHRGEKVVVLGPSGSGKSTMLRCINALEVPDSGTILVDGVEVTSRHTNLNLLREHLGMVFQRFNLWPHKTVLENVMLGQMVVSGRTREEARAKALQTLERVGLASKANDYPARLSGGQQQRVGIARAFVSKPRVIFADEPTGNLDSITSKQVLYRMLQISKQMGTTFVMVTHEPELASCADRIITILDGKVQSDVVQDPATRERNREALFASLEGNMRIGGDSASGEVHQKTAAELASYAAPAAAAQQPKQPKP